MTSVKEDKMDKEVEKIAEEEYQGIAKPVYDILSNHMGFGAKAKPNRMILNADHHAISFEIQKRLRELGYHQVNPDDLPLWVSVKDRLPSGQWNTNHPWLSEEVLIANSCSINVGFYNRSNGVWYVDEPAKLEWVDKITHWVSLPVNPHNSGETGGKEMTKTEELDATFRHILVDEGISWNKSFTMARFLKQACKEAGLKFVNTDDDTNYLNYIEEIE